MMVASANDDLCTLMKCPLIELGAGVLIVVGRAAVRATAQATKTIPIVAIDLETDCRSVPY